MAEHAVQNDRNSHLFCRSAQRSEILLGAEKRVYPLIIGSIIAVIGIRLKDRIQINTGNAERFYIRQFLLDSFKVSAEIVVVPDSVHLFFTPERFLTPLAHHTAFGHVFLFLIAVEEPVREYLINDAALQKIGRFKILVINCLLKLPALSRKIAETAAYIFDISNTPWGIKLEMIKIKSGSGSEKMQFPIFMII